MRLWRTRAARCGPRPGLLRFWPRGPSPARGAAKRSARTARLCKRPPPLAGGCKPGRPHLLPQCSPPCAGGGAATMRFTSPEGFHFPPLLAGGRASGPAAGISNSTAARSSACARRAPGCWPELRVCPQEPGAYVDFSHEKDRRLRCPGNRVHPGLCLGGCAPRGHLRENRCPASLLSAPRVRRIRSPSWQRAARGRPGVPRSGSGPGRQSRGPRRRAGTPQAPGRRLSRSRHATGSFRPARSRS